MTEKRSVRNICSKPQLAAPLPAPPLEAIPHTQPIFGTIHTALSTGDCRGGIERSVRPSIRLKPAGQHTELRVSRDPR